MLQDLDSIMETEHGRRFIYNIISSYDYGFSPDPYRNAYNCGVRKVGQDLLNSVRELPDGLHKEKLMRQEARMREKEEDNAQGIL